MQPTPPNPVDQPDLSHDGDLTVLTYRGAADAVHLLTWMPHFPAPPQFVRISPDTWQLRFFMPGTARIEYRLGVEIGGRIAQIEDPLNPAASNPFGENSVLVGPAYRLPQYAKMSTGTARGQFHEVRVASPSLGGRRHHRVYLPEGFQARTGHPILLVHDGSDFLRYADLAGCLDQLIDSGTVASIAVVLLDPWNRLNEYAASPAHSHHLVAEVLPHIVRRLRLRPTAVGALGSSLGAVAALAAAWHYPEALSGVSLLSGSFAHQHGDGRAPEVFAPIVDLLAALETDPRLDHTAVYQSVGRYEALCDLNRHLAPILGYGAARHRYQETWDGHHWGSWRDRLGDAISFLFPGPAASDGLG